MPAQWLSNSSELSARLTQSLEPVLRGLSTPRQVQRLRRVLLALLAIWALLALARLIWALAPQPALENPAADIVNPVRTAGPVSGAREVDIERMRNWHLFGEAGAAPEVAPVEDVVVSDREGIEEGAQDTRLDLKLRGVAASSGDGLGYAIIEHRAQQGVYVVDDELPVSGRVRLAKVMPRQVILDNGGTYERLVLFEESEFGVLSVPDRDEAEAGDALRIDKRGEPETTALATDYRARLFENPQSLAEVVNVSAVREGSELLGYRVVPGKDAAQFEQLGFKPGDMVTSVNGISLDSPANTMKLYNAMRSAGEVEFELQRGDEQLTLSVGLDGSVP